MPSVEELLSQTLEDNETNQETYADTGIADTGIEYCIVDDDTRLVTIPEKYKKLGVESDEKAKRIWFRFPRLVGNNGVDLSAIGVRVNFRNANGDGDIYIVEDLTTDGDYVIFSWELTRKVTAYKGNVSFVVCAVKSATDGTTKNEWNTTLNKECEVLEGLEVNEQIAQENPDIIEYILANLGGSVSAEEIATAVEEYMTANPITADKVGYSAPLEFGVPANNVQQAINLGLSEIGVIREEGIKNPQKLTFDGAVSAEYDGSGAVKVTIPDGTIERIEKGSTDTAVELQPNKLYVFPEMASLTLTFAAPANTGIVNEYHCVFASGETATTLVIPDTIRIPDSFTVWANKIYELSIMENCLIYQSWDVS